MTEDIFETPSSTPNFQTELASQLAELVPEAVADGKIDVVKLQELLSQDAADTTERFGLFWPGKQQALRVAQMPTTATLRPEPEKSQAWETTKNVFIEGDNLEVLKILQKHYHGKIKIIYIDPPYNTGKDFVYPDNFKEGLATYLEWTKQVNQDGEKIHTNNESDGRFHSNWLNMIYPRLKLARNLLTEDGVMFISINEHEVAHLRKVCDEVFGESNFLAQIAWQNMDTVKNDAKFFSENHEYVLAYARNISLAKIQGTKKGEKQSAYYKNPDNDPRGPYLLTPLHAKSGTKAGIYEYKFVNGQTWSPPPGCFPRFSRDSLARLEADGRLWLDPKGEKVPQRKTYLSEVGDRMRPTTFWDYQQYGSTRVSNKEVSELIGKGMFQNPKPVKLMTALIDLIEDDGTATVLDFFAGSATTADAILQLNAEDGGNRKFILVQLPEPTPTESDAARTGFRRISDLSRHRIQMAANKISEELAQTLESFNRKLDLGFRAYKLAETSFAKWRPSDAIDMNALEQHLFDLRDSAFDAATEEDLLTEILIKQGYSLTESLKQVSISGLNLLSVGDGLVLAYLNEKIRPQLAALTAIAAHKPSRLIILEDAFQGDDELKTNLSQLCKSKNIELWTA